ncbi:putative type I restriction-modification system [Helicobacter cinaedi]|uniref:Putative type I restriction-modification system n=1 Tax=Helicobacter cinaedi TaxID=213 RepID=A0A377JX75_9HELI|nr:restriction endonuclease subunit S [Helicobacter cinaedi]STP11792.1 putative type I restriction-modification system [Helicobacter cinaedi]
MKSFDLESLSLQSFLQSLHKEQWQEVRLGEVAEIVNGYAFKSKEFLNIQQRDSLPIIKIKNVANGDVNLNDVVFYPYSKQLEKFLIKYGDILVSLTGNHPQAQSQVVGQISKYKYKQFALLNQRVAKIVTKDAEQDFLYYLLKTNKIHNILASHSSGSANQANISSKDIENLTIPLPPLTIQQKIAEILSSFDDKIDLLHRQNKTLESLALTLFRHYFIDNPKRDEWELGKLGDYVKIASGKPLEKRFYNENGCYEILGANGAVGKTNKFLCDEKLIYTGRVGTLGKIFLIDYPRKVWLSDNTLIFRTNDSSLYFVYFLLQDLKLENYDVGSTQPLIRQGDLLQIHIRKPNNILILEFNKQAKMYFEKTSHNAKQIQNLQAMRDMLLKAIFA